MVTCTHCRTLAPDILYAHDLECLAADVIEQELVKDLLQQSQKRVKARHGLTQWRFLRLGDLEEHL